MREIEIKPNDAGQRFDKYLKKLLCNASGSFIYKMLRKKNIVLNGKKADGSEKLKSGDFVKLFLSDETYLKFTVNSEVVQKEYEALRKLPVKDLQVVLEEDDILVINKPSGLLSQKANPNDVSANEWILAYLIQTGKLSFEDFMTFRPSICNRLDRNTSGLLIAGKSLKGLQEMAKVLQERTVKKYYRCIVAGEWKETTYLKGYLTKDEASNRVTITDTKISDESKEIETEYRFVAMHHPFTMPMDEDLDKLDTDPGAVRAKAYDIVLNGTEIGGGSVRIYQNEVQEKMFEVLGFTKEAAYDRFGFLLNAFKYGVPPHAGLAYGLDRLVMLMAKEDSIREVIAFPKVKDASCLMTNAPDVVDDKQLEELSLDVVLPKEEQE